MISITADLAATVIAHTVVAGAEVESRDADGQLLAHVPVGRDVAHIDADGLWLRPLPEDLDDGTDEFEVRVRPLQVARYDLIDSHTIGVAHATGSYTVIRPTCTPGMLDIIRRWDLLRRTVLRLPAPAG